MFVMFHKKIENIFCIFILFSIENNQLLYLQAEDMQFSMKPERRKNSLQNYLLFIRQSIERERKGREGKY